MKNIFTQLASKLYLISGEQNGRAPFSHGLFVDSDVKVLVDAGFGRVGREAVLSRGEVEVIINTHFHIDHTYGNRFFPTAKIWAHQLDAMAIRSKEVFLACLGQPNDKYFPDRKCFPDGIQESEVARVLFNGEILNFGDVVFQIVHTPGHSPGHIALYEPNEGILFSGDIDLSTFGPWYGCHNSNIDDFIQSIDKLINLNPKVLVTSHSGVFTDNISKRLKDYAAKIYKREELILKHLKAPKTMNELLNLKIIHSYYPEPQRLYKFFEENMLIKHLKRMIGQNKVIQESGTRFKASNNTV